jgi:hypothetical protein
LIKDREKEMKVMEKEMHDQYSKYLVEKEERSKKY